MHETYASLSHRSAAILGTWRVGRDGEYLMQRSLNDLVQFNPRIPVFSISQIGIGDVAVGGYVPKYENAASVIASQIKEYYASGKIDGTHFRLTDGQYLFDSRKLKELKIAEYALPKGSVVEDTVAAKLSKYSHYIELLVAGIVLLVLLLVSLRRFSCARGVSSARSKSARDSWWSPARRPKSPTCSNRRSWPI